jgi:hypothetical protein
MIVESQYLAWRASLADYLQARSARLEAAIDLAWAGVKRSRPRAPVLPEPPETPEDAKEQAKAEFADAVLVRHAAQVRIDEAMIREQYDAGRASLADFMQVRCARLGAEIRLAEARAATAGNGK